MTLAVMPGQPQTVVSDHQGLKIIINKINLKYKQTYYTSITVNKGKTAPLNAIR